MRKSTLGFEFKVIGANPSAGRTAGMNAGRATMLVLTLSGALVGLAGMSTLSGTDFFLSTGYGGNTGFYAITVALVGRNRPMGVVLGLAACSPHSAPAAGTCKRPPPSRSTSHR